MRPIRWLGLAILVALSTDAAAQEPIEPIDTTDLAEARAMELNEAGAALFAEGRYEAAILAWDEAYQLTQREGFLFNIASAHERLGQFQDAIDALITYRDQASVEDRATLDRRIESLEARLVPPAPVPDFGLAPDPPVPPGRGRRIVGSVLLATGAISAGGGVALGVSSQRTTATGIALCSEELGRLLCPRTAEAQLQAGARTAWLADGGYALGAILATTGTILLITGPRADATAVVAPDGSVHAAVTLTLPR